MREKYIIVCEPMGGQWYYMIYVRYFLLGYQWRERCNTLESAALRLEELNKRHYGK